MYVVLDTCKLGGLTKNQLFTLLTTDGTPWVRLCRKAQPPVTGIFQGAVRESGSGNSFAITLLCDGVRREFYIRTLD